MTKLSDLLYDADLIIEDDGKYYKTKIKDGVIDAYGIVIKVILCKGEKISKKRLIKED